MTGYKADSIKVLEGLEGVRKRPAMYVGSTGKDGLHHLVYEVLDNSVDEALAGHCNKIVVRINKNGSCTVEDNGRGIPVDKHPKFNMPAAQVALTKLHAGGKFDKSSYAISGGLHGVGVSCVNALAKKLLLKVKRGGKIYEQEYSRGNAKTKLKVTGKCNAGETGTIITFWPDEEIFSVLDFDYKVLENRFREVAFLNAGLKIILEDEEKLKKQEFFASGGLIEFVKWVNKSKEALHKPIYFQKEHKGVVMEIAIQYNLSYQENIFGFVNTINTVEGGTHVSGLKTALTRVINDYGKKTKVLKNGDTLTGDDTREGLTVILSLKIPSPQFEGQTKTKLGNSEIKGYVDSLITSALAEYFEENPSIAKKIVSKGLDSAKARLAAKKAKDLVRRKNAFSIGGLPGKLADCSSKKSEESELYLVEGESAGGCFSGDTKVALLDGRNLNFKELVNEDKQGKINFCYTINENGSIGVEKIINPRITKKNTEVIKIILDNNEEIICTPNHKFMLRDRSYKKAQGLKIKDSLMPLNRKYSKLGGRITIKFMKKVFEENGILDKFDEIRIKNKNKNILSTDTFCSRFFNNDKNEMLEAVKNYNHKIKKIERITEKIDVYDIEVPYTHNFALASGVFVHNSAKMARNKETQAILGLKGKILNVEKASPSKALSSEEIANMITAIGTGVGEQFNIEKLRYGKIIIMCDADVDGEHIKTLLLTFFFRFMPQLIENGNVYAAMPPLYRVRKKTDHYVYSDEELKKLSVGASNLNVTRFKGLGEMSAEQLWDTTMNPKSRKIKKIYIEDAVEADRTFSMLMGDDVQARKEFIQENAKEAELDI